jgi:hypothetical protein
MQNLAMNSTDRAQRLLAVWEQEDLPGLQAELLLARQACAAVTSARAEEQERLDLLEGIAGQMQQDLVRLPLGTAAGSRAATCFRLLEHLAARRPQRASQSEKLFAFPYSRSVRKISACR